jgi:hypothetical protein
MVFPKLAMSTATASRAAVSTLTLVAALLSASEAWGLGFELSETKEQLKLEYDLSVTDHGTGRVTINLTITNEGRMSPPDGVLLHIPSQDGTGYSDLSVALERKVEGGKQHYHAHLRKDWADRGQIRLQTHTLDGKSSPRTWYYHAIPIAGQKPAAGNP